VRKLSDRVLQELAESLARVGWDSARAFAESAIRQCAYPLGEPAVHQPCEAETTAMEAVLAVLRSAAATDPPRRGMLPGAESEAHLERDPILLAAVFQNVDLLYRHGFPHADGVSALVMQALAALDHGRDESR
jgi:hypothetical protein